MSTTEDHEAVRASAPESSPEYALSWAARRSGHRSARVLSVVSLAAALVTTGVLVGTAAKPPARTPIAAATAETWEATGALSDALRALRPGASRNPARARVRRAVDAAEQAGRRIGGLELPVAETPLRGRVLRTLRADTAWMDAVGSTLANPRSPRRAELSTLAKRAANATALIADQVEGAANSVGGTGRLLSATKPS